MILLYFVTHGCAAVVASTYPVEEASGSILCLVIPKTLKIVPTAVMFRVKHITVRVGAVITFLR